MFKYTNQPLWLLIWSQKHIHIPEKLLSYFISLYSELGTPIKISKEDQHYITILINNQSSRINNMFILLYSIINHPSDHIEQNRKAQRNQLTTRKSCTWYPNPIRISSQISPSLKEKWIEIEKGTHLSSHLRLPTRSKLTVAENRALIVAGTRRPPLKSQTRKNRGIFKRVQSYWVLHRLSPLGKWRRC